MSVYENLQGAEGRQVYFRGQRFDPKSLFNGPGMEAYVDNRRHRLLDVSISGIATLDKSGGFGEQGIGASVPVQLRVGNTLIHEGLGEVVRVEPSLGGTKLGLKFTDKYLDISRLIGQYQDHILKHRLNIGRAQNLSKAHVDYKLLSADALHILRTHKSILAEWEEQHADSQGEPGFGRDILDLSAEQMLPAWRALAEQANEHIDEFIDDPEGLMAAKDFSEMVITPEMQAGPIWRRSYEKPLGYPGDFRVMDYVYSWQDQGRNLFGKLVHRLGLDALECVATRMSMVQHMISREVMNRSSSEPVRITNLACGGAQEIVNFLGQGRLQRPVHLTLIDQDRDALTYAYERAYPFTIRSDGKAQLQCLQSSFTELMKGGSLSSKREPQDMIYSVGLFDYLRERRARNLLHTLYEQLAPGGLLVIGNLKIGPKAGRWAAELICDWSMIYRTAEEMYALASGIKPAEIDLLTDRTDRIFLLCMRKPKD